MKKVCVVLSTYNGEKYIREQIDSVLAQSYSNIELLVRDDGSRDATVDIVEEYCNRHNNVRMYKGDNLGVTLSFYDLLKNVPEDAEYIALCDQDDVWFVDKIEAAIKAIASINGPALYCEKPMLVDEKLKPLKDNIQRHRPKITFGNAIIENVCTGCTVVFNRALYDIINGKWPKHSLIHDWWIYQVAVCFGKVVYNETPHIYYRQHGGNQIGQDNNRLELMKHQISSLKKFKGKYTAQMYEFVKTFSPKGENGYLARLMVGTRRSVKCRWKILFERRIYRQGKWDNILFKGMLFLGML